MKKINLVKNIIHLTAKLQREVFDGTLSVNRGDGSGDNSEPPFELYLTQDADMAEEDTKLNYFSMAVHNTVLTLYENGIEQFTTKDIMQVLMGDMQYKIKNNCKFLELIDKELIKMSHIVVYMDLKDSLVSGCRKKKMSAGNTVKSGDAGSTELKDRKPADELKKPKEKKQWTRWFFDDNKNQILAIENRILPIEPVKNGKFDGYRITEKPPFLLYAENIRQLDTVSIEHNRIEKKIGWKMIFIREYLYSRLLLIKSKSKNRSTQSLNNQNLNNQFGQTLASNGTENQINQYPDGQALNNDESDNQQTVTEDNQNKATISSNFKRISVERLAELMMRSVASEEEIETLKYKTVPKKYIKDVMDNCTNILNEWISTGLLNSWSIEKGDGGSEFDQNIIIDVNIDKITNKKSTNGSEEQEE